MESEQVIQGRRLGSEAIGLVRHWLATEPGWNRTRLSRELCRRWPWRNDTGRLTDNTRFLIFPWVQVPHLASHLLAQVARQLHADWIAKYGHGIELVETFVERDRFRGICYRAAGWLHVGTTTGRGRNDVDQTLRVPIKDIYLLPLFPDFRRRLCV